MALEDTSRTVGHIPFGLAGAVTTLLGVGSLLYTPKDPDTAGAVGFLIVLPAVFLFLATSVIAIGCTLAARDLTLAGLLLLTVAAVALVVGALERWHDENM